MASKTLPQKLYIRPGMTIALLNAPKGFADSLAPLPDDVKVVTNTKSQVDLVLCFVKSVAELEKSVEDLKNQLASDALIWFAYPKQSGKTKSDLTRDHGWRVISELGLQGVASIAIDDTWSALRFKAGLAQTQVEAIAKQYSGERAALLPLYEQLVNVIKQFGPDIEASARQSYVAFARGKQFALIRPSRDRLDLVLKLPKAPLSPRFESANGLGSGSMTHRVAITKSEDIDHEVVRWLNEAYRAVSR